jgi:hypothetical protein
MNIIELHQFVVKTKQSPANHTQEDGKATEKTRVVCHLQQMAKHDENGNLLMEAHQETVFLEDLPSEIQEKALALFEAVQKLITPKP